MPRVLEAKGLGKISFGNSAIIFERKDSGVESEIAVYLSRYMAEHFKS